MAAGFGGLLLLIIAVGLIGIQQIQDLSRVIAHLAKTDIPLQNAVLEMKSSNGKYAMGIRNYMFWKSAKYLEAASVGEQLKLAHQASLNFDKCLAFYEAHTAPGQPRQWAQTVRLAQNQLLQLGAAITKIIDAMDKTSPESKKRLEEAVSRQLMDFESKLFWIDAFLDKPIQQFNLAEIDRQLNMAERGRRRSIIFLTWSLCIGLGLGAQTAILIYLRSKHEAERRELLWRKVVTVEEEERNNLSLQIHDQMGQDLSALKIFLGLVDKDIPSESGEQKERIERAKKILDALMNKTHNISELLRPPELADLGLIESIGGLVLQYQEMTGAHYNYAKPAEDISLSPEYSLVLYRLTQEALTNIAKYSGAKNVDVVLARRDDGVYLAVSDDGVGFDSREFLGRPSRRRDDKSKLGLQGLRERIELLGGSLRIHSEPGHGTRLEALLPSM
jgi:signal transduction histidine kinase